MQFTRSAIQEVIIVEPRVYDDSRGFFMETYHAKMFSREGIDNKFVQDNYSHSLQNTLRGLHYQIHNVQGKLVRVVVGEVFDVAVDIRRSSQTFGKSVCVFLSANNKRQIWIPPGFAHGFFVTSEWADVEYKATDYYSPVDERTIIWNDPLLGVPWPIAPGNIPILSTKDHSGKSLSEAETYE
jgi:dTDP-4-dehydrorhamnose 3,5-epimerase